jgi:hypothetical protein
VDDLPQPDPGFCIHFHELGAGTVVKRVVEAITQREDAVAFPYVSLLLITFRHAFTEPSL